MDKFRELKHKARGSTHIFLILCSPHCASTAYRKESYSPVTGCQRMLSVLDGDNMPKDTSIQDYKRGFSIGFKFTWRTQAKSCTEQSLQRTV